MSDCIEHPGSRTRFGYAMLYVNGKQWSAHRLAWTLANGPIPDGMWVLHRCDNPPCWNVEHLFLGTASDNSRDRDAKGRAGAGWHLPENRPRGEANAKAKLTTEAVREMRELYVAGGTYRGLARRFGVHRTVARDAILGRTWGHV